MRSLSFTFFRASFHFVPLPGGDQEKKHHHLPRTQPSITCADTGRQVHKLQGNLLNFNFRKCHFLML